jgi:hypothetical protein
MRRSLIGVVLALAFAGAANASDFIVVNSTDPGVKKGQALDAGAHVAVATGKTLTVMRLSGEVTTLTAGPAGVTLPNVRLATADAARFDNLKALIDPPPPGRTFGARRGGGICPPVASLVTLDDILRVADGPGCKAEARAALDAYIAKAGASSH